MRSLNGSIELSFFYVGDVIGLRYMSVARMPSLPFSLVLHTCSFSPAPCIV